MEVSKPTKQGGGRRKIEMKKVEEGSKPKPYSCGDVDAIIDQYLTGKVSDSSSESSKTSLEADLIRKECNETLLKLEEEEKKQRDDKTAPEKTGFWWEKDVDETMEEWLKSYEASLEKLKKNVDRKLEEMRREKAKASTSSAANHQAVIGTIDQVHHDGIVNGDQCRVEEFFNFDGFGFNGGLP
ncbi:hypothetical protein Q3G72_022756 [Acer saccharum]|nr:hypothetical protein Q3G72_022756 [Acer saccharum]